MFYDVGFHSSSRRILLIRSLSLISESARTHASYRHVFHLSRAVIRRRANARVHARTHTHARLPEAESTEEAECGTNSYPIHPNHASRVCLLVKVVKPRLCRSRLPFSLSLSLSLSLSICLSYSKPFVSSKLLPYVCTRVGFYHEKAFFKILQSNDESFREKERERVCFRGTRRVTS